MKLAAAAPIEDCVPSAAVPPQSSQSLDHQPSVAQSPSFERVVLALALVAALWWAQAVLIPVVLSILISYALEPLVARLGMWHIRRAAAVPFVLIGLCLALLMTAYALRGEAIAFVNRIPSAVHTVSKAIESASRGELGTMARIQAAARELETATKAQPSRPAADGVTAVRVEEPTFKWSDWVWSGSRSAVEFFAQMFVVLCLTYYLMAAGDLYKRKLVRIAPSLADKKITLQILAEIDRQIERFLLGRVAISLIVGSAIWLGFRLVGVENAAVWGVLSAVLFTIPIAGPTAVIAAAGIVTFIQFGSAAMAGAVVGLSVGIGVLEGYVLTPWLLSRLGEMNAVAVFVTLLFWGWIWGLWGLFLAVPITATSKAVCERIPQWTPIAEFLRE